MVKIEQEFGFITVKWEILEWPINTNVVHKSILIKTISIIHNYVIKKVKFLLQ